MSESALIAVVPEAEPWIGDLRHRYDPVASMGLPAHITILWPFISPEQIDASDLHALEGVFHLVEPFDFTLREVRRFPQTTYLAPAPARPFIELTERVVATFRAYPPYGGLFPEIIPHLTVADK